MYELAAMCATCNTKKVLHVSALLFHLCRHMPSCGVSLLSQKACLGGMRHSVLVLASFTA